MTSTVKETNYSAAFREVLAREQNDWLKNLREYAFKVFTEKGFPTLKDEEWKYTNLAELVREEFKTSENTQVDTEKPHALFRQRFPCNSGAKHSSELGGQ